MTWAAILTFLKSPLGLAGMAVVACVVSFGAGDLYGRVQANANCEIRIAEATTKAYRESLDAVRAAQQDEARLLAKLKAKDAEIDAVVARTRRAIAVPIERIVTIDSCPLDQAAAAELVGVINAERGPQ